MTGKDFLNLKKPYFCCTLLGCAVLGFAGVVSVLDKETVQPPVEETITEEIQVEKVFKKLFALKKLASATNKSIIETPVTISGFIIGMLVIEDIAVLEILFFI